MVNTKKLKAWIEAMRLRTLPVSMAGVLAGVACGMHYGKFNFLPAFICLLFALMAQIVSNFANEYYDFKNGLDKKGREGFRRGVTEGDLSARAMKRATYLLLAATCVVGCLLIYWGGWWLIWIGIFIAVFALAYSTGPYPLSHHGLGDLAVVVFYGLVPVIMTAWLQTGSWSMWPVTYCVALAIGLIGVNVLIVNNYRDVEDDRKVGKKTTVVLFGKKAMLSVYLANVIIATALLLLSMIGLSSWCYIFPMLYLISGVYLYSRLKIQTGASLNDVLKWTAISMLLLSITLILSFY